jgi:S1-C subfamily serine protease
MTSTELALQPLNSSRFFGSLFSRLVEIAVVVAATLTVSVLLPREFSVPAAGPSMASPTPLVQTTPDEMVGRVADGARPAVAFLIAADAVPVSFTAGGPTSETPGLGSAFIIDDEGTTITNHHVVFGHSTVRALLGDGTEVAGRVLGSDPSTDLAVVKLQTQPGRVRPLPLGDSDTVRVGQRVVVIGSPAGLTHTVTTGIVSAVSRALPAPAGRVISGVIQTDAATFQGNSGGPMLNARGEVVGVMTATLGSSYGFAVPINTVKRVYPTLATRGYVPRPWLGITGVGLSPLVAEKLGFPTRRGVIVDGVVRDGPADVAGIHGSEYAARQPLEVASKYPIGGDVITAVDGRSVGSMDELVSYLEYEKLPGDVVTLDVLRLAEPMRVEVVLSERPVPTDAPKRCEPGTGDYIQVGQGQSW